MKTAVYGGAFNPVHNEHIAIMSNLLQSGYDRVIALISGNPPHKICDTDCNHRLAMLKIAVKGMDGVIIDDIELRSDGIHYAADVLPIIKRKYGDFTYVLGGDSIIDLHKWSRPQSIVDLCPITVYARGEREEELREAIGYWRNLGARIDLSDYRPKNISSTLIRYLAMLGIYEDISSDVQDYIKLNALYDNYRNIKEILKGHLKPARYAHCIRTCECALRLNYYCKLNLDYNKVFLSALLHDCGKGSSRFDILKALSPLKENADEEDRQKAPAIFEYDNSGVPENAVGKPVEHQFVGSVIAKDTFGIDDDEILQAIKYHCTARPEMSVMEKLVYCADVLEKGRSYEGVDELRSEINKDFEKGFVACLERSYELVAAKGGEMYPLTAQAYKYYKQ